MPRLILTTEALFKLTGHCIQSAKVCLPSYTGTGSPWMKDRISRIEIPFILVLIYLLIAEGGQYL